jgi:hypothetical protein
LKTIKTDKLTLAFIQNDAMIKFFERDASVVTVRLITLDSPESQMLLTRAVTLKTTEKMAYS